MALLFVAVSAFPNSARNIHPQLVGVNTVALNFSPENLPGLDIAAVERDIRTALDQSHIVVDEAAPMTLYVRVTYQKLPECPEFVTFRTYVALSEDVVVRRGSRAVNVYVDTWHESEDFVERASKAGRAAHESVLRLVKYFIDAKQYTGEVMKNEACTLPSRSGK